MPLAIDIAYVEAVLLGDGWHMVRPGSFVLDRVQFVTSTEEQAKDESFDVVYPRPTEPGLLVFAFIERDQTSGDLRSLVGPMASIEALRYGLRPAENEEFRDQTGMTTY
jgi:hypothetical protein